MREAELSTYRGTEGLTLDPEPRVSCKGVTVNPGKLHRCALPADIAIVPDGRVSRT